MSQISVTEKREDEEGAVFSVEITEGGTSSNHEVTLKDEDYERLAPADISRKELIEESFRFLLEREPKSSILSQFDLTVIGNYFPEYEGEIHTRLTK